MDEMQSPLVRSLLGSFFLQVIAGYAFDNVGRAVALALAIVIYLLIRGKYKFWPIEPEFILFGTVLGTLCSLIVSFVF